MKPRHDTPQANIRPNPPPLSNSMKKKSRSKHQEPRSFDDMDEASKEAHIVHKIEMAIKRSRSQRRASSRSHSNSSSHKREARTPAQHHHKWVEDRSEPDQNYQIIKTGDIHDRFNLGPKRTTSNNLKSKVNRHKPKPALEAPRSTSVKVKTKPIPVDEISDEFSEIDGIEDDKKGFQVHVEDNWLSRTFSDPTLDTYEHKHFAGQDRSKLAMLDPQRIQCGQGNSASSSSKSGREPDAVMSIIDRIYDKKEKAGNTYTRKQKSESATAKNAAQLHRNGGNAACGPGRGVPAKELISFDNYEDDDGDYYEDDEGETGPIFPSSRRAPSRPASQNIPVTLDMPFLIDIGKGNNNDKGKEATGGILQEQLDEINQLHRDIQRQQDLIKQVSQLSSRDNCHQHMRLNPHESSAEVYQRELAHQAQAELYRMGLVQKSMMLEKQMDIYRRNLEEWNKVRDLAIKEEENRRKILEKAKEVWQAEMRTKLNDNSMIDVSQDLSTIEENKTEDSKGRESLADAVSNASAYSGPTLYQKVAELNKRAVLTDEEQKIIEAEILRELHLELSKQAAEKKLTQKPVFFSERMRNSWSGKQPLANGNHQKSVEEVTEQLTLQIHKLNMELAPNDTLRRGRSCQPKDRSKDEAAENAYNLDGMKRMFRSRPKEMNQKSSHDTAEEFNHTTKNDKVAQGSGSEESNDDVIRAQHGRSHQSTNEAVENAYTLNGMKRMFRSRAKEKKPSHNAAGEIHGTTKCDKGAQGPDDEDSFDDDVIKIKHRRSYHQSKDEAVDNAYTFNGMKKMFRSKTKEKNSRPYHDEPDEFHLTTKHDESAQGPDDDDSYHDEVIEAKRSHLAPCPVRVELRTKKEHPLKALPRRRLRGASRTTRIDGVHCEDNDDDDNNNEEQEEEEEERVEDELEGAYRAVRQTSKGDTRTNNKKKNVLLRSLSRRILKKKDTARLIELAETSPTKLPKPVEQKDARLSEKPKMEEKVKVDVDDDDGMELEDVESFFMAQEANDSNTKCERNTSPLHQSATSSQSTQWTSNKVYIGIDGDAIEAMSFSSKNAPVSPVSKDDRSDKSLDRYTTCSRNNAPVSPVLKNLSDDSLDRYTACSKDSVIVSCGSKSRTAGPRKYHIKHRDDDPSIFEFLEVQYFPEDEVEAPLDEIEADGH
jgi:hypothetical protein